MRFSVALLLLALDRSRAFAPRSIVGSKIGLVSKCDVVLAKDANGDQYDEWYDDFDPSKFEGYNKKDSFGGDFDMDHDYTRDTSRDNSNVDMEEVNRLIAERLMMRKTRRYTEADSIRDELLEKHGVLVRDKEKTWRSGCSASGSGRKWASERPPREPKSFGPNGHDYKMARGAGPIQSNFSEPEIHEMLAARLEAKLNRDYKTADRLQTQLLEAGVVINDRAKEWRADGVAFDEFTARTYSQSDYSEATEDAGRIQAMVNERAQAKAERLFKKADEIRDMLYQEFGVTINDKDALWSIGGNFGGVRGEKQKAFRPFEKAPGSRATDDDEKIQQLVEDRDAARAKRDFEAADKVRDQLMAMNVYVDDKKRQWNFGREADDSYNCIDIGTLSEEQVQEIKALLKERVMHKKNRKFKSADAIRDELRDTFNVEINDRNREWQVVASE